MILLDCWELKGNQTENRKLTDIIGITFKEENDKKVTITKMPENIGKGDNGNEV